MTNTFQLTLTEEELAVIGLSLGITMALAIPTEDSPQMAAQGLKLLHTVPNWDHALDTVSEKALKVSGFEEGS